MLCFCAAIEVRGVSDLASVYNELDVMAVDIARHREVNKDLANTWSRCDWCWYLFRRLLNL